MVMASSEPIAIEKKSALGYVPAFMLHTYVAYTCAFLPNAIRTFLHEGHHSIATWAWVLPTCVLLYRMLEYHAPSSVLYGGSSMPALKYFFVIQTVAPTLQNPLVGDPIRVWAQFSVTAPFYAGVAYSLGALASKHQLLTKLFTFEKHEETARQQP